MSPVPSRPARPAHARRRAVWLFIVIAALAPVDAVLGQRAGTPARLTGKLAPCRVAGVNDDVLCGKHRVYENRAARTGRTLSLEVVVLPATTDSVLGDPLVFLAGGGVVPATRFARFLSTAMPRLRRHRDIVLVDQRGTGASNPLTCPRAALDTAGGLPPDQRFLRYVAACRESLRDRADVRFYTTPLAMDDLDDVREWLGYSTLNLYGASYGTSAAAVYVRQHPARVRSIVMHGVVPIDVPMQVDLARSAQESLDRVIGLCERDAACRTQYPTVRTDLGSVLARFDSLAASGEGPTNPGQPFREALNTALSTADQVRFVPRMIAEAARGAAPPGGPPPGGPPGPEPAPLGVRLAILCSEGLASVDTASIARATAGTFLGAFPVRFQLRWCEGWPTAKLPANYRAPIQSDVPALMLTGELDPITPPAYADRVARSFSRSTVLRLPSRSHSDADACVTGIIESFVLRGGPPADTACLAATPAIQFAAQR